MFPDRLTRIDETTRDQHYYLQEGDFCYFFGEVFAGGYAVCDTNQLLFNYKCEPSVALGHAARGRYKQNAIATIAAGMRAALPRANAEQYTWVPIPSSKIAGHPDYDDRLVRTLSMAFAGYNADIRQLLRQSESTEADHKGEDRLRPEKLYNLLQFDQAALGARPLGRKIVLFDDVLTTGKHFKCCERRIREAVGAEIPIIGVFITRRARTTAADEFENLDAE